MAKIGSVGEFNVVEDDWDVYIERVKLYMKANAVKDDIKVPVLLTMIGSTAYKKLRTLCAPARPETKTFEYLVTVMEEKGGTPKPTKIAARYSFGQRRQQVGESVSAFHLALKEASEHCEFEDTLESRLMEQLVAGLSSNSIREELLMKKDLNYKDALQISLSRECALKEAAAFTSRSSDPTPVHKVDFKKKKSKSKCKCCGKSNHRFEECYFKDAECHECHGKGHIKPMCPNRQSSKKYHGSKSKSLKAMEVNDESEDGATSDQFCIPLKALKMHDKPDSELPLNRISAPPLTETVNINKLPLKMEIDTGAAVSVIGVNDYKSLRLNEVCQLEKTDVKLTTYTKEAIAPLGICKVNVAYKEKTYGPLDLYVLDSTEATPLLGRQWLQAIKLDWQSIKAVHKIDECTVPVNVDEIKKKYSELFSDTMGRLKDFKAKVEVTKNARPIFLRARPVPLSIKELVDLDIERLIQNDVISPVKHSDWATPIVPVEKGDGSIRICGDFKVTVNPVLNIDNYPQPRREELFTNLAGGKSFSKIDLASAYLQMEVDEDSKKYLTINTQRGLFQYNRLPFGIASAPAIFQRTIETLLKGIPGVLVYQDDILVTGSSNLAHMQSLHAVLQKLQEHGLRVKSKKCKFFAPSITYLGHKIDANGISTIKDKVQGVMDAPAPQNVSELRSFLGTVNYYSTFIPDLSTKLAPLNNLLKSDSQWNWSKKCEEAFDKIKKCLCSAPVLAHYNPKLPLIVATDASPYGVAAVLSHRYSDKSERPIAYASRTLSASEKNYSQIDREALAIVFGIRRFHEYLYGQHFTLITDNRPLSHILSPTKNIPSIAAARMQRWAVFLGAHLYSIEHRAASRHANADGLSRLPAKCAHKETDLKLHQVREIDVLPVTSDEIASETRKDSLLRRVYLLTMNGWNGTDALDKGLQPYYIRRNELNVINGVLTYGTRVIIPEKYRNQVMEILHEGHLGMVKMKSLARSYVYWPNIDQQIEQKCRGCHGCTSVRKMPSSAPLHPWEWPSHPWRRLHIDYAGPYLNRMFLVVIDAHSKWPEVVVMKNATSATTITALRNMFARFGLPDQIVSDNGSQFTSNDFEQFLKSNGIYHIKSAPYHPATNGLAERFVQTFKLAMKAAKTTETTVNDKLETFLMAYRNAPHSTTASSPASLLFNRPLRTRLDLLNPTLTTHTKVLESQSKMMKRESTKLREFEVGDNVLVRDYRTSQAAKWQHATISSRTGPLSYCVQIPNEPTPWRRHVDQIVSGSDRIVPESVPLSDSTDTTESAVLETVVQPAETPLKTSIPNDLPPPLRRSGRVVSEPKRLIEEM